jgi:putative ABC transport system substrate-binding protein
MCEHLQWKRLELLRDLLPTATVIVVLVNPANPRVADAQVRDVRAAAPSLGFTCHVVHASTDAEIEAAFARLTHLRAAALLIGADTFFNTRIEQLAALALRHTIPTIYQYREFTAAGGLMAYGGPTTEPSRLAGLYAGRILKGDKPAELPVQQATKAELIINLKIAKALDLTVPTALLVRADEVIE